MLLFKDKVNYKFPGANGFFAHIDAPSYEHMGHMKFMKIMLVVDSQRPENDYLEFVPGSHNMDVKLANGGHLDQEWEDTPVQIPDSEHREGPAISEVSHRKVRIDSWVSLFSWWVVVASNLPCPCIHEHYARELSDDEVAEEIHSSPRSTTE